MVNMRVTNVICLGIVTVHATKYGVLRSGGKDANSITLSIR